MLPPFVTLPCRPSSATIFSSLWNICRVRSHDCVLWHSHKWPILKSQSTSWYWPETNTTCHRVETFRKHSYISFDHEYCYLWQSVAKYYLKFLDMKHKCASILRIVKILVWFFLYLMSYKLFFSINSTYNFLVLCEIREMCSILRKFEVKISEI